MTMSDVISMTELELATRKLANTVKLDTIEACAKLVEQWSESPDRASIAADIRAMAQSPESVSD